RNLFAGKDSIQKGAGVRKMQFETGMVDQRPNGKQDHEPITEQVAHVVSHELSQPLTTITGFADLLARRYKDRLDADADEFIRFIVAGARRMQAMLDDLQTYLSIGDGEPPAAPVDCERVVQAAIDSLGTRMAETRATVTVGPLPHVRGDSVQIG